MDHHDPKKTPVTTGWDKRMSTAPISPLFGLILLLSLFFAASAWAGGPAHGAKGAGMGTAFAAVADDPSAIAHNPAGIGFLPGTQLYLGALAVAPATSFKADNGYREETKSQIFAAPHAYLPSELEYSDVTVLIPVSIFQKLSPWA